MSTSRRATATQEPARVLRFTSSERAFHWLAATSFFVMFVTGLLMLERGRVSNGMLVAHLVSAGTMVVGLALIALKGDRRALSRTRRQLTSLDARDREWLARVPAAVLRRAPEIPAGRFNAGQKVNFMLVSVLFAALFASGVGSLVAGVHPPNPLLKLAHAAAAYTALLVVAGHLYMALVNPSTRPALRGMISGRVDAEWVRRHHPRPDIAEGDEREGPGSPANSSRERAHGH